MLNVQMETFRQEDIGSWSMDIKLLIPFIKRSNYLLLLVYVSHDIGDVEVH